MDNKNTTTRSTGLSKIASVIIIILSFAAGRALGFIGVSVLIIVLGVPYLLGMLIGRSYAKKSAFNPKTINNISKANWYSWILPFVGAFIAGITSELAKAQLPEEYKLERNMNIGMVLTVLNSVVGALISI